MLITSFYNMADTFFVGRIGIFRDDPEIIRIGTLALRFQCLTFTLNGWIVFNNMMMQTIGKTFYASILASARQGLFFIPAILILPHFCGLLGIQSAQAAADVLTVIVTTVLYRTRLLLYPIFPRCILPHSTLKEYLCGTHKILRILHPRSFIR